MKRSKNKVLIVSSEFPPQPGGIGNHAFNLALYLSKQQYRVTVVTDQRSIDGIIERKFDQNQPFSIIRIKRYNFRWIMYLRRIIVTNKVLRNVDFAIASGKFSLWNVATLSLFKKTKNYAIVHGSEVNFKPFLLRKSIDIALKRIKNIIAVSHFTQSLISHLNLNITVIPNGVDVSFWEIDSEHEMELQGDPSLITVGRVSHRKGQLNVIKLLPDLIKEFPELHYHCIGIPSEKFQFLKLAKEFGVSTYITFHGELETKILKKMLADTDIFVMLSSESNTGDVEGYGIAILEANALGVPSIGSKGFGISDAIKDKFSGFLVDYNSSQEFLNAINLILNNRSHYQENAREWAKQHDWSNVIIEYMNLFK